MIESENLVARAEDAVKSAEMLCQGKFYDASVSRSYYAIFYCAEALLLTKGLEFSSHRGVISMFGKHFVKTGIFRAEMGRILKEAFDKRLIGDYSYTPQMDEKAAEEVLSWAKSFVLETKKFLSSRPG